MHQKHKHVALYLCGYVHSQQICYTIKVNIPIVGSLLGPSAMVPSFNPEDAATKFFLRSILCPIWIGLGLYELEYADNAATQDIFTKYHVLINVLSVWTMKEIGGKGKNFSSQNKLCFCRKIYVSAVLVFHTFCQSIVFVSNDSSRYAVVCSWSNPPFYHCFHCMQIKI